MLSDDLETVTFQALAHPTRRMIIRVLQSKSQGVFYTELISLLGLSTGKLNYHLEQLKGVIEKSSDGSYVLTPFGKKALEHLNLIEQRTSPDDEKYVRVAALSQKRSLQPLLKAFLIIGIAMMAFFIALWAFIGYIALLEGAPMVVYVLLPILFVIGASILGVLIYALAKTPLWLKRFEQRFFGEP